ncbi:hypothetical protein LVJ94_07435 [Pendulispora rubella]|uniref:Uncharacterized protein n=1 Tax=Pendulispora rubella TaxID=2741070 RepID=A0ABZ2LD20_9BACT
MASKKSDGLARGAALIKKSIEAAKASGAIDSPEAVPAGVLKKLRLPNDEKISPAMKELLTFDASWIGWSFDDEEPEFEPMSLEEFVEEELGEEAAAAFGEAAEMLGEDCIPLPSDGEAHSFLYIGAADDRGEYPVITLEAGGKVSGFVPFDVWVAQRLGGLEKGELPAAYQAVAQTLAEENGDGRVNFISEARDGADKDEDEDEDDEEGDDEDEDGDDEEEEEDEE